MTVTKEDMNRFYKGAAPKQNTRKAPKKTTSKPRKSKRKA